jgi:hypothetical protein
MDKKSVYLNQRIKKETVKRLRKYERDNKLRPSISGTIEHLLNSQTNV